MRRNGGTYPNQQEISRLPKVYNFTSSLDLSTQKVFNSPSNSGIPYTIHTSINLPKFQHALRHRLFHCLHRHGNRHPHQSGARGTSGGHNPPRIMHSRSSRLFRHRHDEVRPRGPFLFSLRSRHTLRGTRRCERSDLRRELDTSVGNGIERF